MDEFKPSAGFVGLVMRRIAESEGQSRRWEYSFRYKLIRLAIAGSALLGSVLMANPCH
jgi:hypothetical protein